MSDNIFEGTDSENHKEVDNITHVSGMFKNWFIDYASYVILERAVPAMEDGLKPVQRRILHSMWELEDGRYNKVANLIGNTMKYHPHGDASIGDALVAIGQKDLLIDWRWGEAYFAKKLNDFDLSANNGGWQWASGSGCDAAPYFRVFNPSEQQKKFDPNFIYIKK